MNTLRSEALSYLLAKLAGLKASRALQSKQERLRVLRNLVNQEFYRALEHENHPLHSETLSLWIKLEALVSPNRP